MSDPYDIPPHILSAAKDVSSFMATVGMSELCGLSSNLSGRVRELEAKLEAAKSVLWMAEQYADGHAIAETGAEQRELEAAMQIINS